jgi:hypothetical protein
MGRTVDTFGAKTNKMFAGLQANWLKAATTIFAMKKAFDFAEEAAQFQQMEQGFANLAASHEANSNEIIDSLKKLSAQTISTADLMKSAGNAMVLGIPAERLDEMMEIARASSRVTGQSIQKSFDDISVGIGRQSRMILDNLGIIVDSKKAYEDYAKAHKKTVDALTESEKKQAFANATMEAGLDIVERVNIQGLTAAESMQAFSATMQNVKVSIGKALIAITSFGFAVTQLAGATLASALGQMSEFLGKFIEMGSVLPWVGDKFKAAGEALKGFAKFEFEVRDEAFRLADSAFAVAKGITSETKAFKANTEALKENLDALKADEELRAKIAEGLDIQAAEADAEADRIFERTKKEAEAEADKTVAIMGYNRLREESTSAAYRGMENQIMRFIEVGKFSVGAMAKVVAQQVKIELVGIAARSSVHALFQVAMGIGRAAVGDAAGASAHFASAKTFGLAAAAAGAGAAGVQALFGGTAEKAAPGAPGGEPLRTEARGGGISPTVEAPRETREVTIIIQNPLTGKLGDEAAETIFDIIHRGGDMNFSIPTRIVQG